MNASVNGNMSDDDRVIRFEGLVNRYGKDLYRYGLWLCRNDALTQDLLQSTYLRAFKALHTLKNPDVAKAWLITILRREFVRQYNRQTVTFIDLDSTSVLESTNPGPEESLELIVLRKGIQQLPQLYREPLLLQVIMGYTCEEIALQLGITRSAVMTQLFRAREKLKAILQKDGITGNINGLENDKECSGISV